MDKTISVNGVISLMDKSSAMEEAKQYASRVRKEMSPASIMLFGSYANGTPREWSDIDIAVIFDEFNGDWLNTSAHLWKLTRESHALLEPHLLDKSHDRVGFVEEVMRTGLPI